MAPKKVSVKDISTSFYKETIISVKEKSPVSYQELLNDLRQARVIYLGERHTDPAHHKIQLKVIKDLYHLSPNIIVGMEMFDQSYQHVLNLWTSGRLDRNAFIKKTHWYANWKMDYNLYSGILDFVKEKRIMLIGLNIPFHIPPKIATGGIDSLIPEEKRYLPKRIDTSNQAHRKYVKKIFDLHHVKGIDDYDNFYVAQCVWEDTMAEAISRNLGKSTMIVITGNGHIVQKFGIPDRAFERTQADFRTVYLASPGSEVELSFADYIWVTPLKE